SPRAVYVYDDLKFPSAGVGPTAVQGIFDHLAGELLAHNYPAPVAELTATNLLQVLKATGRAASTTIVLMTGVLPANVFSPNIDYLSPWVRAGGLAVWGGGTI